MEGLDEAITLIESSALIGHQQAVAALAAMFYTGYLLE
jgi:hypothetical protein